MFVPPEQRSVPPEWEPPRRPAADAKRKETAAITLIILIAILALFAPIAGGSFVAMMIAVIGR